MTNEYHYEQERDRKNHHFGADSRSDGVRNSFRADLLQCNEDYHDPE